MKSQQCIACPHHKTLYISGLKSKYPENYGRICLFGIFELQGGGARVSRPCNVGTDIPGSLNIAYSEVDRYKTMKW
ncbi:MAG TPA: hypothetical protein PLE74_12785 [Candidatus Cloacimonadota bacterium]|nr:hypothetical protein [Candidatus Cloacimonadota bacterium]